jgi:glycosyltransferase involved in cell wall biosynthesis
VAHQWPPVFEAPSDGPFVLYQPWEFGEIPAAWVEPIRTSVDEVWTPSEYSRQAFTRAGLAPELIRVVPNGVDLERFSAAGAAYRLPTSKRTVFLFVGGTTYRKGIDLLLEAYGEAFSADDDVCLVVKSFGAQTVYRGQGGLPELRAFAARPGAPELVLLEHDLAFEEIPTLYRAADCLVQPYRGEGFCLPALEALASGLPVIVTAGGPTDDFSSPACAWQLPSRTIPLPANALGPAYLPAGGGTLLEPDRRALVAALRAATDPAARAAKAATAREHAARFGWPAAAAVVTERLAALAERRPIRHVAPAALVDRRALLLSVEADWDATETWAPAVRAFARAFASGDQVTLLLPDAGAGAEQLVLREILAAGASTDQIADLVLTGRGEVNTDSIALAADAFICTGGRRPLRARRVVEAEPAALRTLLPTA